MKYISRSQIETWRRCPRKGWLTYGYKGKGVRSTSKYVPLVDGGAVHAGVAEMLRTGDVESGVSVALGYYEKELSAAGAKFADVLPEHMEHTKLEQAALVEALVRVWWYKEYAALVSRYHVRLIEKEIAVDLPGGVVFLATADAVLQEKSSNDVFVYSLKTMASHDVRAENNYQIDLQGITESAMVEQRIKKKVAGVRYCFLIKGPRYKEKDGDGQPTGLWIQDSPLIRGWKRYTVNGVAYAHRYRIPNEYGGGWTTLGKGWIKFNAWEEPGLGTTKWIEKLHKSEVQPVGANVVTQSCYVPTERFKYPGETRSTLVQIDTEATEIQRKTRMLRDSPELVDMLVPKYQHSCYYPGKCEFADTVCHKQISEDVYETVDERLREGRLEWRISHHPIEQKWLDGEV